MRNAVKSVDEQLTLIKRGAGKEVAKAGEALEKAKALIAGN